MTRTGLVISSHDRELHQDRLPQTTGLPLILTLTRLLFRHALPSKWASWSFVAAVVGIV